MQTTEDRSYGAVIFKRQENDIEFFLIHQYGSRGDVFWTFPKGHAEEGETPTAAATREVREETGLDIKKIYEAYAYTSTYTYQYEDTRIDKTVVYYLAEVANTEAAFQSDEVKDGGWFNIESAKEKLTFDTAREVLEQAARDIASLHN